MNVKEKANFFLTCGYCKNILVRIKLIGEAGPSDLLSPVFIDHTNLLIPAPKQQG